MLHADLKKFLEKREGSVLVTGPPGTGKTYQLINLIKHLIVSKSMDPGRLLVFCFNRRIAKILRDSTARLIGESIFEVPIKTFFAYCADMIKGFQTVCSDSSVSSWRKYNRSNTPMDKEIRILNAPEQWNLLKNTVLRNLTGDDFPITSKYVLDKNSNMIATFVQEIFDFILRAQENLITPEAMSKKFSNTNKSIINEVIGIYSEYRKFLIEENLYNYGRLLEDTVFFLKNNTDIREKIRDSYDFVIVDDLQEVNRAQYEILKSISQNNCIFFGNDDQSMYSFRGSAISIFNEVFKLLYSDDNRDRDIIFLENNYRSGLLINDAGMDFIGQNEFRLGKKSKPYGNNKDSIYIKEFKSTFDEVSFIVDRIRYLILKKNIKPEEIIILVKGRGYKTRLLENMLNDNNIRYLQRSSRALLDNKYVKYILNFMQLIIFLEPYFNKNTGFDESSIVSADESGSIVRLLDSIIFSGILKNNKISLVASKANKNGLKEKLELIRPIYKKINDLSKPKGISAYDAAMQLLGDKTAGILKYLLIEKTIGEVEKSTLTNVLGDFFHIIRDYAEANEGNDSIGEFLSYLEDAVENSFLEEIEDSTREFIKPGFINIMSYHQCRGLEFNAVFLPFMNKNYLPAGFGNMQLYDLQIFNFFSEGNVLPGDLIKKKHLEDERKLFYNGLTRSRQYLFVSSNTNEEISRFFNELRDIYLLNRRKKSKTSDPKKIKKIDRNSEKTDRGTQGSRYFSSGKEWLMRKSLTARTFKCLAGGKVDVEKFNSDLNFLASYYPCWNWWRMTKYTINKKDPSSFYKTSYSYSKFRTFKDCPYKYKIKYYFGIDEEENLSFTIGRIYHGILKDFFVRAEQDYTWSELKRIIDSVFNRKKHSFELRYLRDEILNKAYFDFKRFYDHFVSGKKPQVIMEKNFSFNIGDEIVKGRIDQINLVDDERVELIDFKSGTKNISKIELEKEIQLRLYRTAVDLCSELDFIKGKKIDLKYIYIGDDKSREPWLLLPGDIYDSGDFIVYIRKIIEDIKNEHFPAEPENKFECQLCSYKLLCPNKKA